MLLSVYRIHFTIISLNTHFGDIRFYCIEYNKTIFSLFLCRSYGFAIPYIWSFFLHSQCQFDCMNVYGIHIGWWWRYSVYTHVRRVRSNGIESKCFFHLSNPKNLTFIECDKCNRSTYTDTTDQSKEASFLFYLSVCCWFLFSAIFRIRGMNLKLNAFD